MGMARRTLTFGTLFAFLALSGCMQRYTPPESPMPPNTVLLSQMMRELSAQPGFTESFLQELQRQSHAGKRGPALLTPSLIDDLRKLILGKNWQGLDRFPGWSMRAITSSVGVIDRVVTENGSPAEAQKFLDLGPYALDREQTISLDKPSTLPPFTIEGIVTQLAPDVTRGDGPNHLAPEHAESQRLADVLNRLAANALDGAESFGVMRPWAAIIARRPPGSPTVYKPNPFTTTPQDLIFDLEATGHSVTVIDARYFANFGHLHYQRRDVMMPFWVNTGFAVPGTGGPFGIGARPLLVPVAHAEYDWQIRGPKVNADISYYYGIDGKSEWRTLDTLDQAWVLKRAAHTYTGAQAVEVTRLAGLLTVAYMHQHHRRPKLAFGGYYTLGVCQDGVAAIEHRMTGKTTLFPNTADDTLFDDARDAEVNALLRAIPKDRNGAPPDAERIFGSLPIGPGAQDRFSRITIPGLADDLQASYAAWQSGKLHRMHSRSIYWIVAVTFAGAGVLIAVAVLRRKG